MTHDPLSPASPRPSDSASDGSRRSFLKAAAGSAAALSTAGSLSALHQADELPRSAIGKVLKRELRDRLAAGEFA